jgi:hypothetical protein
VFNILPETECLNSKSRLHGLAGTMGYNSDEKMVCYIINTAEYCRETVNPLGESVAKTLDKPFSDEIDMTAEEDEFSGVITKALQSLVAGVGAAVEEQLAMLVRALGLP